MATVELRFSPSPEHVRTARLIVTAVARRAGVDEPVLDELRLAVGEACSRAVELHRRHLLTELVTVLMDDADDAFTVTVVDAVAAPDEPADLVDDFDPRTLLATGGELDPLPSGFGLVVIDGLVDDVDVQRGLAGTRVRMAWKTSGPALVDLRETR
jgi:anti-sigma regulatory factor (Ser/Thr protein kinase)